MSYKPDEHDYGDFFEDTNETEPEVQEPSENGQIWYEQKNEVYQAQQERLKRRRRQCYLFRASVITVAIMLIIGMAAILTGLFGQVYTDNGEASTVDSSNIFGQVNEQSSETNTETSEASKFVNTTPQSIQVRDWDRSFELAELSNKSEIAAQLSTQYVYLYDATHDKVLYSDNSSEQCYPASTTKLLTAIVAQAIIPEDMKITVGEEINLIGYDSSTAYLNIGYVMNLKMLLQGLLLPSGNDAAYVLAVNAARVYTGNDELPVDEALEVFADLMNDVAQQLGTTGTHFVVPDGFHNDDHYTTASDMARIAAYAYSIPIINEVCSTFAVNCELLSGQKLYWENSNSLINPYSYLYNSNVTGMKTGFTDEAGTCLVASAEVDGVVLIAVLMHSENLAKKYENTNLLFKEGFASLGLNY